jgi:hypothetical protein
MRGRRKVVLSACLIAAGVAAAATGVYVAGVGHGGWEVDRTDDPALIAIGRALFDDLPDVAGAVRDPYGTACGMPEAEYCTSAPGLAPDALIAAVGSQLATRGAHLERRDCSDHALGGYLPDLCTEIFSYRGVDVAITASDEFTPGQKIPTYVHGTVLRKSLPPERAAVPLGSWESLGLTPATWGALPCAAPANGGCVGYAGNLDGPGTPEDARRILQSNFEQAGYRIEVNRCDVDATGSGRCRLAASRFRTLGGRDGVLLTAWLSAAQGAVGGFTARMNVTADNAPAAAFAPDPAPTSTPTVPPAPPRAEAGSLSAEVEFSDADPTAFDPRGEEMAAEQARREARAKAEAAAAA